MGIMNHVLGFKTWRYCNHTHVRFRNEQLHILYQKQGDLCKREGNTYLDMILGRHHHAAIVAATTDSDVLCVS